MKSVMNPQDDELPFSYGRTYIALSCSGTPREERVDYRETDWCLHATKRWID